MRPHRNPAPILLAYADNAPQQYPSVSAAIEALQDHDPPVPPKSTLYHMLAHSGDTFRAHSSLWRIRWAYPDRVRTRRALDNVHPYWLSLPGIGEELIKTRSIMLAYLYRHYKRKCILAGRVIVDDAIDYALYRWMYFVPRPEEMVPTGGQALAMHMVDIRVRAVQQIDKQLRARGHLDSLDDYLHTHD